MNAQIEHNFKYHPPTNHLGAAEAHSEIRSKLKEAALFIDETLPAAAGREKASAITALEQAMMWACAGVARHGVAQKDPNKL